MTRFNNKIIDIFFFIFIIFNKCSDKIFLFNEIYILFYEKFKY